MREDEKKFRKQLNFFFRFSWTLTKKKMFLCMVLNSQYIKQIFINVVSQQKCWIKVQKCLDIIAVVFKYHSLNRIQLELFFLGNSVYHSVIRQKHPMLVIIIITKLTIFNNLISCKWDRLLHKVWENLLDKCVMIRKITIIDYNNKLRSSSY